MNHAFRWSPTGRLSAPLPECWWCESGHPRMKRTAWPSTAVREIMNVDYAALEERAILNEVEDLILDVWEDVNWTVTGRWKSGDARPRVYTSGRQHDKSHFWNRYWWASHGYPQLNKGDDIRAAIHFAIKELRRAA